ncbi:hypothetical protein BC936DRAFT_136768 [Jimgerdemannia flammicorona]|uniref:Uncharacterized protein n=1 Tax=Jimgerdemannia flammicorona TaxID=994334 RepID=A0A433CYU0_9FUNG|nr:hypothetical protein BC936DRAFT_136768 [Jimgerdemannia flammicorona]
MSFANLPDPCEERLKKLALFVLYPKSQKGLRQETHGPPHQQDSSEVHHSFANLLYEALDHLVPSSPLPPLSRSRPPSRPPSRPAPPSLRRI